MKTKTRIKLTRDELLHGKGENGKRIKGLEELGIIKAEDLEYGQCFTFYAHPEQAIDICMGEHDFIPTHYDIHPRGDTYRLGVIDELVQTVAVTLISSADSSENGDMIRVDSLEPRPWQALAESFLSRTRQVRRESTPVSFDPDDYPVR